MENFKKVVVEFEDIEINSMLKDLNDIYFSNQRVFAKVCFTIYRIRQYFKDNYYQCKKGISYNFYSLMELFGFDKSQAKRYRMCFENYCQGNNLDNVIIKDYYVNYCPTKLIEMLPLSYKMLVACLDKQIIRPEMTCKQIRQIVKQLAGKTNPDDLVAEDLDKIEEKTLDEQEAELPEAFDPKKTHTYEYFKAMSKEALITCLFQCEDYIKKLTTKKAGK